MKTPSKKVTYFFVCSVAIVTIIISYSAYQNKKPREFDPIVAEKNLAIVVGNQYRNSDSDADGLFDWEETLWNTDPGKADTDNDGTRDGAEVALSRDPKKAGPDDAWTPNSYLEQYVFNKDIDPDSLTARIAQSILVSSSKQSVVGADVANELLKKIQDEIKTFDIYKSSNIITFSGVKQDELKKYANEFVGKQLEIAQKTLALQEPGSKYAEAYKQISVTLSTIAVPEDLVNIHTNFINNLNKMSVYIGVLEDKESDPLALLAIIPEYAKISDEQNVLIEQIKTYLQSNGIILDSNE